MHLNERLSKTSIAGHLEFFQKKHNENLNFKIWISNIPSFQRKRVNFQLSCFLFSQFSYIPYIFTVNNLLNL